MREVRTVIQRLRRAMFLREGSGMTDAQMLESFIERRDSAAFEALVEFHGPMVFGVCHRILGNHHDAEEAFQATFLVLARRADSIFARDLLANWLFGVARRTALKAKGMRAKRQTRERQVPDVPEPAAPSPDGWRELMPLLDDELSRLPTKYRSTLILCDLEGKTHKEAARRLGATERAVAMRLLRARNMLAKRLSARGIAFSAGALAILLTENGASAAVPARLVISVTKAAGLPAASQAAAAGLVSANVAALTEGVLRAMFVTRLKTGAALLILFVVAGFGTAELFVQMQAAEKPPKREAVDIQVAQIRGEIPQPNDADEDPQMAQPNGDPGLVEPEQGAVITREHMIVAIPADHKSLVGYSNGKFRKQDVRGAAGKAIRVIVGANLAAVQTGNTLWGFDGTLGSWHSVELPEGSNANIDVSEFSAHARVGSKFYVFRGGAWNSVDLGTDQYSYRKLALPGNSGAPGFMGGGGMGSMGGGMF